ncbi:Uncharacterized protein MSYG_2910 [Malassezia sympodialis ATCC 42132]|uniref:Uncharacterized protein n=1 Tax=Malassezia sympodialis (strain ATCC 42132) TaxID=1230383 RepID=A0A1M8A7Z5_MALS4|nr:Uncharacterized protein MSYG_2910 [Malassezia sympodialis ATCC 42132]
MRLFALPSLTRRGPTTRLPARLLTGLRGAGLRTFHSTLLRASDKNLKLRDEDIRAPLVRLVDPASGQLQGPFQPSDILAKIDRKAYALLQVTEAPAEARDRAEWHISELPICRLISKRQAYQKEREKKKAPPRAAPPKVLQLSWNVTENDLTHKVARARKDLERGARLRTVIVSKKGTPRVLPGSQEDERRIGLVDTLLRDLCAPHADSDADIARVVQGPTWKNGRSLVEWTLDAVAP